MKHKSVAKQIDLDNILAFPRSFQSAYCKGPNPWRVKAIVRDLKKATQEDLQSFPNQEFSFRTVDLEDKQIEYFVEGWIENMKEECFSVSSKSDEEYTPREDNLSALNQNLCKGGNINLEDLPAFWDQSGAQTSDDPFSEQEKKLGSLQI